MEGTCNMKCFLEFIGDKKHYFKHINEDAEKNYDGLPCSIDVKADTFPNEDPKLDDFLRSLKAFIENWLYDWEINHPNE